MLHSTDNSRNASCYHTAMCEKPVTMQTGKVGYILMWFLGIPLPLLVIWYLIFGSS